jgi:hypothetical protein
MFRLAAPSKGRTAKKRPRSTIAASDSRLPILDLPAQKFPSKSTNNGNLANAIEMQRWKKAKSLRSQFRQLCKVHDKAFKVPVTAFDRWQARSKQHERKRELDAGALSDPYFPSDSEFADPGLVRDLKRHKMPVPAAEKVSAALSKHSTKAAMQMVLATSEPNDLGKASEVSVAKREHTLDFSLSDAPKPFFQLNHQHYEKLQKLYKPDLVKDGGFEDSVYRLLCRYNLLGGHGNQAALSEHGFSVLGRKLDVQMECFASPLNCHFPHYCSAFPDTDRPFGSSGSFFDYYPTEGSFEANPPFVPEVMSEMVKHIESLLRAATGPLSFSIIVPRWPEVVAWKRVQQSKFRKGGFTVKATDHGFCNGAQHESKDRYRPSSFDTEVVFLQNPSGATRWPVTAELEDELRNAFTQALPADMPTYKEWEKRGVSRGGKQQGYEADDIYGGTVGKKQWDGDKQDSKRKRGAGAGWQQGYEGGKKQRYEGGKKQGYGDGGGQKQTDKQDSKRSRGEKRKQWATDKQESIKQRKQQQQRGNPGRSESLYDHQQRWVDL